MNQVISIKNAQEGRLKDGCRKEDFLGFKPFVFLYNLNEKFEYFSLKRKNMLSVS